MEVHVPEHPIHTWREFFIHMGTICLGLLIAIGLEQGVEALHRRHQAQELRESLHGESEQVIADAEKAESETLRQMDERQQRKQQIYEDLWDGKAVPPMETTGAWRDPAYPADPIFHSIVSSGRGLLLSPAETNAYTEVDYDLKLAEQAYIAYRNAVHNRESFETEMPQLPGNAGIVVDFSRMAREDLRKYMDLTSSEITAGREFRNFCLQTIGLEKAILQGERDLSKLYAAENAGLKSDPATAH